MIVIGGTVKIRPDKREEAIAAALEMAEATQQEVGCISYRFYSDISDPNTFLVFEEWASAEALAAHFESPHMAVFRSKLPDLVVGEFNITRYDVSSTTAM